MTLQLPARHAAPTRTVGTRATLEVQPGIIRVGSAERTLGFIEQVGRVYVSLAGTRYDRAVEVAQSLTIEDARAALLGH